MEGCEGACEEEDGWGRVEREVELLYNSRRCLRQGMVVFVVLDDALTRVDLGGGLRRLLAMGDRRPSSGLGRPTRRLPQRLS